MNYITPANYFPVSTYPDRPSTRPVDAVVAIDQLRDRERQYPSDFVFKGEVVDSTSDDKRYRPQANLQINPENKRAISLYQQVSSNQSVSGRILDRFI